MSLMKIAVGALAMLVLVMIFNVTSTSAACTPNFAISLNFIGGTPPGAPTQWPIYIDGAYVGSTNNRGYLQTTSSVGAHVFSTSNTWTYKGKQYRYSGRVSKTIACNTWSFSITVDRA